MREYKYKAWHKTKKAFMYFELGELNDSMITKVDDGWYLEDCELMQYTGLKDGKGQDIYENDVVIWDGGQYSVIFSKVEGAWILKDDRADWECPSLYGVSSPKQSRIEIIGSIYTTEPKAIV